MKINRNGSAAWSGGLKDGKGSISTRAARSTPILMALPRALKVCRAATPKN